MRLGGALIRLLEPLLVTEVGRFRIPCTPLPGVLDRVSLVDTMEFPLCSVLPSPTPPPPQFPVLGTEEIR